MKHCYLFETKSIQNYLFRSGKLKDVIAASERLGAFINSDASSVLAKVLKAANLDSDLLTAANENSSGKIKFLRCKGGAMYACADTRIELVNLRSAWTLTVQQLFPSLLFIDALGQGASFQAALTDAHRLLNEERNTPDIAIPIATAIAARDQRTGFLSVPLSPAANRSTHKDEPDSFSADADIELHRQAYTNLNMKSAGALQDRFTPVALRGAVKYPTDLDTSFPFAAPNTKAGNKEAVKDIALIHLDGNGLGTILLALKDALKDASDAEFCAVFRQFSEALSTATEAAAQESTGWLASVCESTAETADQSLLPMRPLVLGGDDITLLCRADLALTYSKRFCSAFKRHSGMALKPLFNKTLKKAGLSPYLTASGGIVYHKAGHPFVNTHHVVEEVCQHAKNLTKSAVPAGQVGPAALAFYRMNTAAIGNFDQLLATSQAFEISHNKTKKTIKLGLNAFFVEDDSTLQPNLKDVELLAEQCRQPNAVVSMNKWRQMAGLLALGDMDEAQRIYFRAVDRANEKPNHAFIPESLKKFAHPDSIEDWYWHADSSSNELQSLINDLLVIDHFRPVTDTKEG